MTPKQIRLCAAHISDTDWQAAWRMYYEQARRAGLEPGPARVQADFQRGEEIRRLIELYEIAEQGPIATI